MKTVLVILVLAVLDFQFSVFNSQVFAADTSPPQTQAYLDPQSPDGGNGWYKSPVTVTLSATDLESGVQTINWKLDAGSWNSTSFSETLNLAQNPSFETVDGPVISNWAFSGMPSSAGASDSSVYQFGSKSIRVDSYENGWSGFNNQASYVPATPFANMTASVWVKTQGVTGTGVYFKIYALTSSGPVHLADSQTTAGTSGFSKISRSFSVSADTAYGIYLDLGIMGTGTAWYDGVSITNAATDTRVVNTYASPGIHTLEYYSVDFSQNTETPHKSLNFKVDSTAPTNWREFETTQQGNDHTLKSQIKVDDSTSFPDPSSSLFQYSVDGGSTWGYYSNLTSCSSSWVGGGWSNGLTTSTENSGRTLDINTNAVDFCNSNWQICKIIRFKQKDMAGNESTKDVCINGAWVEVSGDVGANYNINFGAAGAQANNDGVIVAHGSVSNFATSTGWVVSNYNTYAVPTYLQLLAQFPTSTPLPSGKLPTVSGRYLVNSSFTVSNSTIPSNFGSANFSAVVFINGNLTVNSDLNYASGSSLLFIVSGDILLDKNVQNVDGNFITDGEFDTSYNGNGGRQLTIYGTVAANLVSFSRSLGNNAETEPSEQIIFQPVSLLGLANVMGSYSLSWKEVAP